MKNRWLVTTCIVLSVLVGLFLAVSGGMLLWARHAADILFDMNAKDSFEYSPLVTQMGIRQLCIGLMIVSLAASRQIRALGIVMVIGSLVPLLDFVSFAPTIGVISAMRHGAMVPIVLALGLILIAKGSSANAP